MAKKATTGNGRLTRIEKVLREGFKKMSLEADIRVNQGWEKFVHVRVVAPVFRDMNWDERETLVWEVLESGLSKKDLRTITLVMTESPEEAVPDYEELRARHELLQKQVREKIAKYTTKLKE